MLIIDEIPENPYRQGNKFQNQIRSAWDEGQQSILSRATRVDINQKFREYHDIIDIPEYGQYGHGKALRKYEDFIKKYPTFGDYLLKEEQGK